jgi:hypothetical protein
LVKFWTRNFLLHSGKQSLFMHFAWVWSRMYVWQQARQALNWQCSHLTSLLRLLLNLSVQIVQDAIWFKVEVLRLFYYSGQKKFRKTSILWRGFFIEGGNSPLNPLREGFGWGFWGGGGFFICSGGFLFAPGVFYLLRGFFIWPGGFLKWRKVLNSVRGFLKWHKVF